MLINDIESPTGYQHFEFCVIKDLAEPSKKLALESGTQEPSEELLFDFANEVGDGDKEGKGREDTEKSDEDLLAIGGGGDGPPSESKLPKKYTTEELLTSELLLENLLGPIDLSPETESASEALDLGLAWPESSKENGTSSKSSE
jgi:hypothetical protein